MTFRAAFIADGSSDLPIADHLATLCVERGAAVVVTPVDRSLLGDVGSTVKGRLDYLLGQSPGLDLIFVHRDAEAQPPDQRRREIADAASDLGAAVPVVPVVPVRMTEAWLLLDEGAIRSVAGKPEGRATLTMPRPADVESLPNPKAVLMKLLLDASEVRGRRRVANFQRDFGRHRALLIQRLDLSAGVRHLTAWRQLEADLDRVFQQAS